MQNRNNSIVKKFLKDGYVIINALNQGDFNELKKSVVDRINTKIKKRRDQHFDLAFKSFDNN